MSSRVGQMTPEELKEMIGAVVEQKLLDVLGDPDEGLVMVEALRRRLLRQKKAVSAGERGEAFEDVVARAGLD